MRRFCRANLFLEKCSSLRKVLRETIELENIEEPYRVVAEEYLNCGRGLDISLESVNDNFEVHWLGFASVDIDYIDFVAGAIPYWKNVRDSYGEGCRK